MLILSMTSQLWATPFLVDVEALLDDPELQHADIGLSVRRLVDGVPVFMHQEEQNFVPASTMKWITAVAVAERVGLDHQLTTSLYLQGERKGTLFRGNVILKGGGDPELTAEKLDNWARDFYLNENLRRIEGNVVVDTSFFAEEGAAPGWSWDDLSYRYGAPSSALSLNKNSVKISFRGGKNPRWGAEELKSCFQFSSDVAPLDSVRVERLLGKDTIHASGPIHDKSQKISTEVSMVSPSSCAQKIFIEGLTRRGVGIEAAPIESQPRELVFMHHSSPVAQLLETMLKWSQNLYAENLMLLLDPASEAKQRKNALPVVAEILQKANVEPKSYRIVDGSGLSRYNLLTPDVLTKLTVWLYDQPYGQDLIEMLPVAGVDGTLAKRMKKAPLKENVRAKTGSMSTIRNLTGLVRSADGQQLAVTIFINGYVGPSSNSLAFQEQFLELLAKLDLGKELKLRERWWVRMRKRMIKRLSVGL